MKCHVCGGEMVPLVTDIPFKVDRKSIVILKDLPVLQCGHCREYLMEDAVMEKVEAILAKADPAAKLEIVRYAA